MVIQHWICMVMILGNVNVLQVTCQDWNLSLTLSQLQHAMSYVCMCYFALFNNDHPLFFQAFSLIFDFK
jgi:hypothetical protein